MNTRRELIFSLGASALVAPLGSFARQQGKQLRVCALDPTSTDAVLRGPRMASPAGVNPMPVEKQFSAKAVKLNYIEHGPPAAPPLVMLHGGAWRWQEYLSLIPSLGRGWHTYALDLRGNGRSGWVSGRYRLADFADDNTEFVERLNAPAVLVGHSIGGVVALMVAARRPDRVRGLIIEDVPLTREGYRTVVDSSREMFGLWLQLKRAAQSEQDLAFALADAYRDYPAVTSPWILFFAGCLWQIDPGFFANLLEDFEGFYAGYEAKEILSRLACPSLFLRGESPLGAVMTDDDFAWLERNGRNAQCISIKGVGHLLHLEASGQTPVLTAMLAFLDGI
jgi:pimeloyl-ACP methyl ester carboxylesterase